MGKDVWISNDGGEEGWFWSLEEGVYDQSSTDPYAEMILLKRQVFI